MTLPYHVLNPMASPVVCRSVDAEEVEYRSMAAAAEATGLSVTGISHAAQQTLKGKYARSGDYQWAYLTKRKVVWPTKHSSKRRDQLKEAKTRPVLRSDGTILPCIQKVAELNNCPMATVRQAIKRTNRMICCKLGGFQWAWADKPPRHHWPSPAKRKPPVAFRKSRPVIRSDGTVFSTLVEASHVTMVAVSNISAAALMTAKGFYRKAGGYQWAYEKPDIWPTRRLKATLLRSVVRADGLRIDSLAEAAAMLSIEPEQLIAAIEAGTPVDDFLWRWQ